MQGRHGSWSYHTLAKGAPTTQSVPRAGCVCAVGTAGPFAPVRYRLWQQGSLDLSEPMVKDPGLLATVQVQRWPGLLCIS
jgi:hypothetical protein